MSIFDSIHEAIKEAKKAKDTRHRVLTNTKKRKLFEGALLADRQLDGRSKGNRRLKIIKKEGE